METRYGQCAEGPFGMTLARLFPDWGIKLLTKAEGGRLTTARLTTVLYGRPMDERGMQLDAGDEAYPIERIAVSTPARITADAVRAQHESVLARADRLRTLGNMAYCLDAEYAYGFAGIHTWERSA